MVLHDIVQVLFLRCIGMLFQNVASSAGVAAVSMVGASSKIVERSELDAPRVALGAVTTSLRLLVGTEGVKWALAPAADRDGREQLQGEALREVCAGGRQHNLLVGFVGACAVAHYAGKKVVHSQYCDVGAFGVRRGASTLNPPWA